MSDYPDPFDVIFPSFSTRARWCRETEDETLTEAIARTAPDRIASIYWVRPSAAETWADPFSVRAIACAWPPS